MNNLANVPWGVEGEENPLDFEMDYKVVDSNGDEIYMSLENCWLLAAAPDLLEALSEVMVMVNAEYHFDHPTSKKARAAINRAIGGVR